MGQSWSRTPAGNALTEEDLEDYHSLTYFSKKEILAVHQRFTMLAPDIVKEDRNTRLPKNFILAMPELKVNPFKDRIIKIFSPSEDGSMSFEDFLDMMSVFSDGAPRSVKTEYVFRIYDFDDDDMISSRDLQELIKRLVSKEGYKFKPKDIDQIIDNVMNEADLDEDQLLAYAEFEHVLAKSPDFMNTFRIRL